MRKISTIIILIAILSTVVIFSLKTSVPSYQTKETLTTLFWVGEESGPDNANISNYGSWWQSNWQLDFGGIDDPNNRCGFYPCDFIPKENPFYFALPYSDTDTNGNRKENAKDIPWFNKYKNKKSVVKNRWIEIKYKENTCYAQWQDVGPLKTDDFDYVFGDGKPTNDFGVKAGLDISPATWDCLGLTTNSIVSWKFVSDKSVPKGPWKDIVTTSDVIH